MSLPDVAGGGPVDVPPMDPSWVDNKAKKAALKLEKLDSDLKNYKSNSIKESIRRGNDDLGDHHLDCGDLSNALKCYSRARDYCTSGKHVVNMCLNVIKVELKFYFFSMIMNYSVVCVFLALSFSPFSISRRICVFDSESGTKR